jgi:hypothetical protein
MSVPTKKNILVQVSKILQTISLIYWVNPFIIQHRVEDILSERRNGRTKHVKLRNGHKTLKIH